MLQVREPPTPYLGQGSLGQLTHVGPGEVHLSVPRVSVSCDPGRVVYGVDCDLEAVVCPQFFHHVIVGEFVLKVVNSLGSASTRISCGADVEESLDQWIQHSVQSVVEGDGDEHGCICGLGEKTKMSEGGIVLQTVVKSPEARQEYRTWHIDSLEVCKRLDRRCTVQCPLYLQNHLKLNRLKWEVHKDWQNLLFLEVRKRECNVFRESSL